MCCPGQARFRLQLSSGVISIVGIARIMIFLQFPREHPDSISGSPITPDEIVENAVRKHCQSVAYTYTEPTIFFELAYDTSRLAHERGLKNLFVTNGYMTQEALETISPYLDGAMWISKALTTPNIVKSVGES